MSHGIALRQALVLIPMIGVAIAGAIASLDARGADESFLARQQNPVPVRTAAVEELLLAAPNPAPPHARDATRATCRAEGRRELRNPWRCQVRYPSGTIARFVVTLRSDGSYVGDYVGDDATATGCCLRLAGTE